MNVHGKTFRQALIEGVKTFPGDAPAQLALAVVLTLCAVLGLLARYKDLQFVLIVLPFMAIGLAGIAGMFLFFGGAGWLAFQLMQLLVRWRAHEEMHEGMSKTQMAWVVVGVVFLGAPEFANAISWWQANVLHYVPGEEAGIKSVVQYYGANRDSVWGGAILAVMGCVILWKVFKDFRTRVRASVQFSKRLLQGRNWRIPSALTIAMAATGYAAARSNSDRLAALLSIEFLALGVWLLSPLILPNLVWIVLTAACVIPAAVVSQRLQGEMPTYVGILLVWGGWLLSVLFIEHWAWRVPYWCGVLGFLVYLLR